MGYAARKRANEEGDKLGTTIRCDYVGVDIEARNSPLDFDLVNRLSNSSIASTVESGLNT